MWDMYATFEDMISGSGQRDERAKATLLALSSTSSSSSLNTSLLGGGKKLLDNIGTSSLSSSTGNTVNQEVDSVINSCSSENSANDSPGSELGETVSDEKMMTSCKSMTMETINSQQQIDEEANSVNLTESLSSQSTLTPTSLILPSDEDTIKSSDNNGNDNVTLTNNGSSDKCDRQFRPIPTSKGKLLPKRQSAIDKLVDKPAVTTNLGGYQSDSGSNSSLANPLLDTISCLTSSDPYSDSDDYDVTRNKVIHQRARRRCRRMLSDRSLRCSPNHLHSCCSSDADSIGYAGSNSIDSGYKSLCPTPEVPESISNLLPYKVTELTTVGDKVAAHTTTTTTTAKMPDNTVVQSNSSSSLSAFQRLSNLNLRNQPHLPYSSMNQSPFQVSSLSIKSRDNSQSLTLNRGDHPIASSSSSSSISGSYSSRGGASVSSRLKGQSTEAHLEHLLTLRQSLISAIQKCEPSTPTDSRVASPVISSRSTSPASTVIPRTVTNLKIKPSASPSSYGGVSYSSSTSSTTLDSNQMLHQSSIHRTGCSSPTTIAKPCGNRFSPEPWYSQHNYSPSPSQQHHYNYYSQSQYSPTVNSSRFSRTVNTSHLTIPDNHQSPIPMTSSPSSLSIESNLITPTQSSDIMGYKQQQNYSSSTLSSSSVPFNTNKSVRFEEVMVRSLTNYSPSNDLIMSLNCNTIETNDYPTTTATPPPTELSTERSILSTLSNSSLPSIVASGLENTAVDCINDSGSSSNSLSSNSFNGNTTTTTNSNTDCSNNNINGNISIGANNSANYNGISSSSSSSSTGTFSTKSILKDPICANLRTSIESEKFNAAQSLENEIDSLLYGKHFTDSIFLSTNQHLENATINESQYSSSSSSSITPKESTGLYHHHQQQQSTADDPLNIAYVKMIEEKYRTANRTKIQDHDDTFTSHLIDNNASNTNETIDSTRTIDEVNVTSNYQRKSPSNYIVNHQGTNRFDSQRVPVYHHHQPSHYRQYQKQNQLRNNNNSLSKENVDSRLDSLSKSKISEMAKCMLGILDEIEMKNSIENRLPQLDPAVRLREKVNYSPRIKDRSRPNSAEFRGSLEVNPGHLVNNMETASESSYHSLPEYHIYEEVAYDYMMREHQNRPVSPQVTVTNTRKERPPVRRILPPNPSGSMTMLNNLRFSGNSSSTSSSVYRSSLKDLFNKPFDGNNNHRLSSTTNGQDAHLSRASGRYETELKCFRSSSSSPLSSSRTSTSTLNNQTAINNSNDSSNWRSWGRVTEQPKQRGNLYSLFTDPDQRINIGRSLRKDHWNYNQQSTIDMEMYNQMDRVSTISSEYGFKNN